MKYLCEYESVCVCVCVCVCARACTHIYLRALLIIREI